MSFSLSVCVYVHPTRPSVPGRNISPLKSVLSVKLSYLVSGFEVVEVLTENTQRK